MEISEQLLSLFSGQLKEQDESYVLEIPDQELQLGEIDEGETYRVALLSKTTDSDSGREELDRDSERDRGPSGPPLQEGETREVEIEDIGEKGDGITRVERGFVIIVPDTEPGEWVTIEINNVRPNVAFAEVVERQTHLH